MSIPLFGLLVIAFMLSTSGKASDRAAALGAVLFYVKAFVVVVGLILLVNVLR